MAADTLALLAARTGRALRRKGWRMATAESCTGGWVAKAATDVAGSSLWFEAGYVTYSNASKQIILGVKARTLARFGAVSEEVVREMAQGALQVSDADVAVAVSGIAGPDGGSPDKPVGLVWFCWARRQNKGKGRAIELRTQRRQFRGDRAAVRAKSVTAALRGIAALTAPP